MASYDAPVAKVILQTSVVVQLNVCNPYKRLLMDVVDMCRSSSVIEKSYVHLAFDQSFIPGRLITHADDCEIACRLNFHCYEDEILKCFISVNLFS